MALATRRVMARWHCGCTRTEHDPRLVVLTGGPGAGKTATLEIIQHHSCEHVVVLPEAASLLFKGGFPRRPTVAAREAAQRAIFRVQRELERMAVEERQAAVILCDRGTPDGAAYWPPDETSFFAANETTREAELARYDAVIHLRTPPANGGYDHRNPVRVESARQAAAIDEAILHTWAGHPRRSIVESENDFLKKAAHAIALVLETVPECCRPSRR
jgi:predicted ATPase